MRQIKVSKHAYNCIKSLAWGNADDNAQKKWMETVAFGYIDVAIYRNDKFDIEHTLACH